MMKVCVMFVTLMMCETFVRGVTFCEECDVFGGYDVFRGVMCGECDICEGVTFVTGVTW